MWSEHASVFRERSVVMSKRMWPEHEGVLSECV